jgi:non-specific serine/threonine protein kinase
MARGLLDSLGARRSAGDREGARPELSQIVARALALFKLESTLQPKGPGPTHRDPIPLSRREREVAALIARGLTNREIAAELVIAERTAGTHVSNLLGKLGARTRSQIAAWAVEHDLRTSEST